MDNECRWLIEDIMRLFEVDEQTARAYVLESLGFSDVRFAILGYIESLHERQKIACNCRG